MSTGTLSTCLCVPTCATIALAICPAADAVPLGRECFQTQTAGVVCLYVSQPPSGIGVSAFDDCNVIPPERPGPRCIIDPTIAPGAILLPNGEWGVPLPREQWPQPGLETRGPTAPPENDKPDTTPDRQPPGGTPQLPDWDFVPGR